MRTFGAHGRVLRPAARRVQLVEVLAPLQHRGGQVHPAAGLDDGGRARAGCGGRRGRLRHEDLVSLMHIHVLLVAVGAKVEHLLLDGQVVLAKREHAHELVALGHDIHGLARRAGQDGHLVGAHAGDDAPVLNHALRAHEHHCHHPHAVRDRRLGDRRHGHGQLAQGADDLPGLGVRARMRLHVDDFEAGRARAVGGGGGLQHRTHDAAAPVREHHAAVAHKAAAVAGDGAAGGFGALDEQPPVAEQVLPDGLEVAAGAWPVVQRGAAQGGDEVALEEVGTGGEGDWVGDGAFELGGGSGEEVERFGDGGEGGGELGKEQNERFDGGDGHGEVGIGGEEGLVGRDDAGCWVSFCFV